MTVRHKQNVPLPTEPGISLIILTPMKMLQRNLNRSTFLSFTFRTQWGMSASNIVLISSLVVRLLKKWNRVTCIRSVCDFHCFNFPLWRRLQYKSLKMVHTSARVFDNWSIFFYIPINIYPTRCNFTQFIYSWKWL
jgi:hypothetical protein